MTQPPPPPNQPPPQGGFGPPQDQPPAGPETPGAPATPPPAPETPATPPAGQGTPATPPAGPQGPPAPETTPAAPPAPAAPPGLQKGPQPGYGYPQAPQAPQAPQPPQPQPGYGYPQAPQPGYGFPQAPQAPQPPQPGYGFPQAPQAPQPPQPQPGYGYPGAQPNPYAQPAPPMGPYAQQPGYGYPGGPTVPMPAPPGRSGGGRNTTALVIIVAAVVAIALIVGGGVWYAKSTGGDGKKDETASSSGGKGGKDDTTGGTSAGGTEKVPSDPASKVLFQVDMPQTKDTVVTSGSWLTDSVYAKSGVAEIVGYNPAAGTEMWTVKLPGPVCTASKHVTEDNKTAVVFQPRMPKKGSSEGCSQVAAIDLDKGTRLWTKTVKNGDYEANLHNVTVSQHTVAVGSSNGGAAFDIGTGKALWQPKPEDSCVDAGYGGGPKLVAVRKCGSYGDRQLHIQTIDPTSGKVISDYRMTAGIEYAGIVSTDPLVVAADVGDSADDGSGISDYFSIDNKTGKLLTRISAPSDTYAGRCDSITRVEDCREVVAGNGRLYVPTEEHDGDGDYSKTNEIVVFDLATGKQTGQRAEAGDGYTLSPLRMDGGNLIAYKHPPYNKGGRIVTLGGPSFKATTLLENPATESVRRAEVTMLPEYAEILYGKGRLYMSAVYAHKSTYGKDYLLLAFGAGG
ncbi:outer membrane protein assembly factor BamB family protein [Streptomyces cellostaticus]|uniref:outer membrane protein assembly factor BamB family protein n=1 Tax=Streptomyces cellostaticus TaxID=67285 RepID=UPI002026A993|nr:PQQ-binding-like beta-propeller repeat protein [Streptomyces cellostaticus]